MQLTKLLLVVCVMAEEIYDEEEVYDYEDGDSNILNIHPDPDGSRSLLRRVGKWCTPFLTRCFTKNIEMFSALYLH